MTERKAMARHCRFGRECLA